MADGIQLIDPEKLVKNPENPRLIFHLDELALLQDSIRNQGVLVPLTVYRDGKRFVILDGERRWRCSLKLGMSTVPAIIQPKPDPLQNLMMMFAIHNQRRDWDPLPTAYKLEELEKSLTKSRGRAPTEAELGELASMSRGEVRRLKNLLKLPQHYRDDLMKELEKPRAEQVLTVDHVLETTRGSSALVKREVITQAEGEQLNQAVIKKFREGKLKSTVEPRRLARIARAVEREEVTVNEARTVAMELIEDPVYTIEDAFKDSIERVDYEHESIKLVERLVNRLEEQQSRNFGVGSAMRSALDSLSEAIARLTK